MSEKCCFVYDEGNGDECHREANWRIDYGIPHGETFSCDNHVAYMLGDDNIVTFIGSAVTEGS